MSTRADWLRHAGLPPEPPESSRLVQFDNEIATITQRRGKEYAHPSIGFDRAIRMKAVVAECKNPLVRHVLEMICVKMARLIQTPEHLDSWIDIAGYARTGVMVTSPQDTDANSA